MAHAFFTFFLLIKEFSFPGGIAAIAFGRHVFAHGRNGFARNDLAANGRLNRNFKEVARDKLFEAFAHLASAAFRIIAVNQHRERINGIAIDEDRHFHKVAFAQAYGLIIKTCIAFRDRFQPVIKIKHNFIERQFIFHHGAPINIGQIGLNPATILAEFQYPAQMLIRCHNRRFDPRFLNVINLHHIWHIGRIMKLHIRTISQHKRIDNTRRGRDQIQIKFAL